MTIKVLVLGAIWLSLALCFSATGAVAALRPPLPQMMVAGLTVALLLAFWRASAFRSWVLRLPLPTLLLPHVSRFVGFYFLVLHARGELPYAFAVPGGWGDIVVSISGVLLLCIPREAGWTRKIWLVWNIVGLADILFVIATAARLALADPPSMSALLRLPLSLLPTFFLPLIIATHVILFARLAGENQRTQSV